MTEKHIGCLDGSTIGVSRHGEKIIVSIGDKKAGLSLEGTQRLVDHLTSLFQTDPRVEEDKPILPDKPPPPVTHRETLYDLMAEGLVQVGTELTLTSHGKTHYATITHAGLFNIKGHLESTPSGAGQYVMGRPCSGWRLWRVKDGPILIDLRWKLRAKRFPVRGPNDTLSDIQKQKRMIVTGWVDHALHRGLNPGRCNEKNLENYLDKRQREAGYRYTKSTLDSYRRHLLQWCDWW